MATRRSREAALSDLVGGLLDARSDPATERFDAELAAAEEDGRVDPQTAKVLRWWQREALRALVEHSRTVLPPTLLALEQAAAGADREAEASAASWARAVADDSDDPGPGTRRAGTREHDADAVASSEPAEPPLNPPADLSEHRRRLLVAGLTRVRTNQH
jgi:hypothetical protein